MLLVENSILSSLDFFAESHQPSLLLASLLFGLPACHPRAARYGGSFLVIVKSSEVSSPPFPFLKLYFHPSRSFTGLRAETKGRRVAPEAQR